MPLTLVGSALALLALLVLVAIAVRLFLRARRALREVTALRARLQPDLDAVQASLASGPLGSGRTVVTATPAGHVADARDADGGVPSGQSSRGRSQ